MAKATLELPALLSSVLGGVKEIAVKGATLQDALADAYRRHPALKVHLVDESGAWREHVLCFHNGVNTRWSEGEPIALADGDRLTILQAVSGG